MKALLLTWVATLALMAGAAAWLWSYEPPRAEAEEVEPVTITEVGKAPVLSSGRMEFDASLSAEELEEEDCPTSC